jgi:hypothetical protein
LVVWSNYDRVRGSRLSHWQEQKLVNPYDDTRTTEEKKAETRHALAGWAFLLIGAAALFIIAKFALV